MERLAHASHIQADRRPLPCRHRPECEIIEPEIGGVQFAPQVVVQVLDTLQQMSLDLVGVDGEASLCKVSERAATAVNEISLQGCTKVGLPGGPAAAQVLSWSDG